MTTAAEQTSELTASQALAARLRAVAEVLLDGPAPEAADDPAADAGVVLDLLVRSVSAQLSNDRIWLLLTAVAAGFPLRDEVDQARREFELSPATTIGGSTQLSLFLLDTSLAWAIESGSARSDLWVAVNQVVVEVDQSARHDLHTGIQQVSRNLLPRWDRHHDVTLVAWTDSNCCLRGLDPVETNRVLRWHGGKPGSIEPKPANTHLVVPWRSVLVLVDVPEQDASDRLSAVGAYSSNRMVAVAHDAIPIASADLIPLGGSGRFGRYLAAIKFATRIAGTSHASTAEIAGFVAALPTQGLVGPDVVKVTLPDPTPVDPPPRQPTSAPMILVVGSHEPRKNHLAVLHAAELLWQQGLRFSLTFMGGMGWGEAFPQRAAELIAKGRDLEVRRAVDHDTLQEAFASAAFTVFPSLHEGFGLPVNESFAHRTPVITSNFGSTREIAAQGGALLVDPRDDDAITEAIRLLLTDAATLEGLRQQIDHRELRTWDRYADELWVAIVEPELEQLKETGISPVSDERNDPAPWLP